MRLECLSLFGRKVVGVLEVYVLARNGERSGLVDDQCVDVLQVFESHGVLDEYAVLGCFAHAYHKSGRRGESHGTRTGNHKHRYR